MKLFALITIVSFCTLTITGCKKENVTKEPTCFVQKIQQTGVEGFRSFEYNENNQLVKFETHIPDLNISLYHLDNNTIISTKLSIGTIKTTSDNAGNLVYFTTNGLKANLYYSAGSIVPDSLELENSLGILKGNRYFTYYFESTNNNVTKVSIKGENNLERLLFESIQYDSKKNHMPKELKDYHLISTLFAIHYWIEPYNDFSFFSKNNPLETITHDYLRQEEPKVIKYNYNYNKEDYPIKVSFIYENYFLVEDNLEYSCN